MAPKKIVRRIFKYSRLTAAAHRAMDWIGSVPSLIAHTAFFIGSFTLVAFGYPFNDILLIVTTIVSLEAIYMAIFIQMAVNQNTQSLGEVEKDIDEIQEDIDEIQKDVDEIEKDIDEIQEDVDEMEKEEVKDEAKEKKNAESLEKVEARLVKLLTQLEKIKDTQK